MKLKVIQGSLLIIKQRADFSWGGGPIDKEGKKVHLVKRE
jgi:hypothetical protein